MKLRIELQKGGGSQKKYELQGMEAVEKMTIRMLTEESEGRSI
jgi:hypothetical protein